jgi:hypothetical protein
VIRLKPRSRRLVVERDIDELIGGKIGELALKGNNTFEDGRDPTVQPSVGSKVVPERVLVLLLFIVGQESSLPFDERADLREDDRAAPRD